VCKASKKWCKTCCECVETEDRMRQGVGYVSIRCYGHGGSAYGKRKHHSLIQGHPGTDRNVGYGKTLNMHPGSRYR
jgi:hypothetical protein